MTKTRFFLYFDKVLAYLRMVFAITIALPATIVFSGLALGFVTGGHGFQEMAEGLLGNSALVQRQLGTPVAAGQIAICKSASLPSKELDFTSPPLSCPAIEVVSYDKYVDLIAKFIRNVYLFLVLLSALIYWMLFTRKDMIWRWAQPGKIDPELNAVHAHESRHQNDAVVSDARPITNPTRLR